MKVTELLVGCGEAFTLSSAPEFQKPLPCDCGVRVPTVPNGSLG